MEPPLLLTLLTLPVLLKVAVVTDTAPPGTRMAESTLRETQRLLYASATLCCITEQSFWTNSWSMIVVSVVPRACCWGLLLLGQSLGCQSPASQEAMRSGNAASPKAVYSSKQLMHVDSTNAGRSSDVR